MTIHFFVPELKLICWGKAIKMSQNIKTENATRMDMAQAKPTLWFSVFIRGIALLNKKSASATLKAICTLLNESGKRKIVSSNIGPIRQI